MSRPTTNTHYDTLGVPQTATQEEIKKAFKALAMAHHPDKNPDDPDAEYKFKKINGAYQVLSSPRKRIEYDSSLVNDNAVPPSSSSGVPGGDVWSSIFGGGVGTRGGPHMPGVTAYMVGVTVPLRTTLEPQTKTVPLTMKRPCSTCRGLAVEPRPDRCDDCVGASCRNCGGAGVRYRPCKVCGGLGYSSNSSEVTLNIPRGVMDGSVFQVGNVAVNVRVEYPEGFDPGPDGSSVFCDVALPYHVAVLGGSHPVTTIEGTEVTVKFPPLRGPTTMIKLRGQGVYANQLATERGSLILRPYVSIPDVGNLTEEHKTIIESLAKLGSQEQATSRPAEPVAGATQQ